MKRAFLNGFTVNVASQIVTAALQFISIPVYISQWGAPAYGIWLLYFSLPAYLAVMDLGYSTAAGNDMTLAVAKQDYFAARRTFQTSWIITATLSVLIGLIGAIVAFLISVNDFPQTVDVPGPTARAIFILVLLYGLGAVQMNMIIAAYRSAHLYARGVALTMIVIALESSFSLALTLAGYGLLASAIAYTVIRWLSIPACWAVLRLGAPWLSLFPFAGTKNELTRLLRPALASLSLPFGFAVTLQGSIAAIGFSVLPAAVAAFSTVRVVTRTPFQLANAVSNAVMPEFTLAVGRSDIGRAQALFVLNATLLVCILVPGCLALALVGVPLVRVWTNGHVDPPVELVLGLTLAAAFHASWLFVANLLLAVNRHRVYASAYPIVSIFGIVAVRIVAPLGLATVAIPLVAIELTMLLIVWWEFDKFMRIAWTELWKGFFDLLAQFRKAIWRERSNV
ncbi:lipopolysaccharide biosynthesis protein [Bradyrhizobium vignae]|uniref:lipopolysaccharide biosynthesis protein n=1 Tax=Bradyrhizobium vignae TaxID=1549949 RepID=UPI00100B9652|nr:hypothetical protein [Bradyrhizobium vignae]RXG85992.1 hypothetical protein EAV90_34445 [Bradyrhizobium vignae]